ncbi:hypothetical protein AB1E18_019211 [Capra hircus]
MNQGKFEVVKQEMTRVNIDILGISKLDRIGDLVSTDQPFGLSTAEYGFRRTPFDGVLGLNYPSISSSGAIPIFDKLKNEGAISEPVFAFYLSKDGQEGSVVMFGGVDHRYYKGELNWVPLIPEGNWMIGDLVSTDQPFGLSVAEYGFEGRTYDGVLGLNYPNKSFSGAIPIFDKLKNQGAIPEPVFPFYLSKDKQEGSVVMFGGVDHRYYKGKLNWVPLIEASDWSIHVDR